MLVEMQLYLPRDARYVSVMRNVAQCALSDLHAPSDALEDIKLALTEACANAVKHATASSDYSVRLGIGEEGCEVEVIDAGPGFEPHVARQGPGGIDVDLETGRGLYLIQALVDELQFIHESDATTVRLFKRWPAVRLTAANAGASR